MIVMTLGALAALPVAAAPLDLEDWLVVETPNVRLLTDAEPARGAEVAATLERFRSVFARLAPGLDLEAPAPTRIIAFRNAERYAPYRRGGGGGVAVLGQFQSGRDGNVLSLDADAREVGAFAVIYHEYVHYLVGSNLPDVPRWFNEGLAEYYSSFEVEGGVARIGGPVPRHMAWFARQGVPSVADLIAADSRGADLASGAHGADEVGDFYGGSWLLVHYLLSGDGERLDQTAAFLARVAHGEEPIGALEDVFGVRASRLDEAVAAHADAGIEAAQLPVGVLGRFDVQVHDAAPTEVLVVLGDVAARLGDLPAATRHFYAALEHAPQHAGALAGLAWVRDLEGRHDEAEVLFGDALASGSDDPLVYLRWGRHLLATPGLGGAQAGAHTGPQEADSEASGAGAVARRFAGARHAFHRVTELDPDFAEGWAMHGIAHLAGDVDPAKGIPSLERAIARLPARLDLVAALVSLEVRARRFDAAEARIDRSLAGRADDIVVASAREEVARGRLLDAAETAFAEARHDEALRLLDEAIAVTSDAALREQLEARLRALEDALGG